MPSENTRSLPGIKDLFSLPRWALVAFVVRCAQRVFPILEQSVKDLVHAEISAEAIRIAMAATIRGDLCNEVGFIKGLTAPNLAKIETEILLVSKMCSVASAAARIARLLADDDVDVDDIVPYQYQAASAADLAQWFAVRAAPFAKDLVADAVRKDYEWLKASFNMKCNPAHGIEVASLGPLWTNDTPEWYYETELLDPNYQDTNAFRALPVLELHFEPGSASKESLQRLMEALSKLHIANGGSGLKFRPNDGFVCVAESVAV